MFFLRSASALLQLDGALGRAFASELPDLASAYRSTLAEGEWEGTLDLQLPPCARGAPPAFSSVSADTLFVDGARCRQQCSQFRFATLMQVSRA